MPDSGGTWTPALASGTSIFDPTLDPAGAYTYSFNVPGCTPVSAVVVITVNTAPNAGTDNAITLCDQDATLDLFTQLGFRRNRCYSYCLTKCWY